jgi:sodium-dependent dicarboxylate transporter 2/3/5
MAEAIKERIASKSMSYWIKTAIPVFIMIFFRYIPPFGGITELGITIIGIFLGAIVGWCICDETAWPSLLACIMLGLLGGNFSVFGVISSAASSSITLQILFIYIFAGIILSSNFSTWAAKFLLSRKFIQGRPYALSAFLAFTMWALAPFGGMALMILLWEVIIEIAEQAGYEKKSKWSKIMVYSILYNVLIGFYYNFSINVIGVFGLAKSHDPEIVLNGYPFIVFGLVTSFLLLAVNLVVLFFVFRPDVSRIKSTGIEAPPPMDKRQKFTLFLVVGFVILQVVPSALPATWGLTIFLKQFGVIGVTFLALIVSFIVRIDGKPFATIGDATKKGIAWGPLLMAATAFVIAGAMTGEGTGVKEAINALLAPIVSNLTPFMFGVMMIVGSMILTAPLNDVVVAAVFLTILYSVAPTLGLNPFPYVVLLCYSCYLSPMLPSTNPIVAMTFANKDKINPTDMFKFAAVSMVSGALILIFVGLPLAQAIWK